MKMNKWIDVRERLPEHGQVVIAIERGKTWDFGQFRGGTSETRWNWKKNTIKKVDYWMPKDGALPPLPPEE